MGEWLQATLEAFTMFFGILAAIAITVFMLARAREYSEALLIADKTLKQWAKSQDYVIRAAENKSGAGWKWQGRTRGPFTGEVGMPVYRVVVTKIGEDRRRAAWIRLGRDMVGDTPNGIKVIWEDEWRPSEPPADL